ncbi:hypothetical protein phiST2_0356 [Vibrio phage phi-ST2]|nr:hypothetical protein phiGrn1_0221 [Vibrio phage phi-Grn1]ALP47707.1 hypothetical protein phiST2_0356 [Vibrio phage phi-ST2]QNJ54604.1 hypothetical protein vBValMR10Z_63 [Vibrio phage vB_ValM_R10Z]QNJ54989.1 hypothetical protein vBValMR11Z_63 [Vibrio phage vB_ValM_R11Z]URQ03693.1 hypothetical protein PVA23_316 [Vibrio phage PVA23]
MVERQGFILNEEIDEHNQSLWQIKDNGQVVYESYNEYCLEAFLKGVRYSEQ